MIQHSMTLVKDAIACNNHRQTHLRYRKQMQWEIADVYGKSSYVVMMGGLHTEMASPKMVETG